MSTSSLRLSQSVHLRRFDKSLPVTSLFRSKFKFSPYSYFVLQPSAMEFSSSKWIQNYPFTQSSTCLGSLYFTFFDVIYVTGVRDAAAFHQYSMKSVIFHNLFRSCCRQIFAICKMLDIPVKTVFSNGFPGSKSINSDTGRQSPYFACCSESFAIEGTGLWHLSFTLSTSSQTICGANWKVVLVNVCPEDRLEIVAHLESLCAFRVVLLFSIF